MANWSNTIVRFYGDPGDIEDAYDYIKKYIFDGWIDPTSLAKDDSLEERAGYSIMELYEMHKTDKHLEIIGKGRWTSPSKFFIDVAKMNHLHMEYLDAENGADFTHIIEVDDGKVTEQEFPFWTKEHFDWLGGRDAFLEEIRDWYDYEDEPIEEIEELINYYNIEKGKEL